MRKGDNRSNSPKKRGMTLVEVLLAALLLGLSLSSLLSGLTACLNLMKVARDYQEVQWVMQLGLLEYPIREVEKVEDLVVKPDDTLVDGYVFERVVDEKTFASDYDDDGLYVVRTRVTWGHGGEGECEETVRYFWLKNGGEYRP